MTSHDPSSAASGLTELRVGVMCDRTDLARWQRSALERLLDVPGVQLTLVVVNGSPDGCGGPAVQGMGRIVLPVYERLARRRIWQARRIACDDLFGAIPRVECTPVQHGDRLQLAAAHVAAIDRAGLDVLIRFGFAGLGGDVLDAPRFGTWSYPALDMPSGGGAPALLWELADSGATVTCMLARTSDRDGYTVPLMSGRFRCYSHSWSSTVSQVLTGVTPWLSTVSRHLLDGAGLPAPPGGAPPPPAAIRDRAPSARMLAALAARWVMHRVRTVTTVDEWDVGLIDAPIAALLDRPDPTVRWLGLAGRLGYVADPFGVLVDGCSPTLLAEHFDYRTRHGSLVIAPLDVRVADALSVTTLDDEPHHLSYPHAFEHDGVAWVVPESSAARRVSLHQLVDGRLRWHRDLIVDRALIDPTLIVINGRWWMFCTDADMDADAALCIFSAPDLHGPWTEHARNPVKTDVRSSRPAGSLFVHDGVVYRPAQDCSLSYGGAVVLNRIETLTDDDYREQPVQRIDPHPSRPDGIHHVSTLGDATLVDGMRYRRSLRYLPYQVRSQGRRARRLLTRLVRRPLV